MPVIRQGSTDPTRDPNSVEYLCGSTNDDVIQCYIELKGLQVNDISGPHKGGEFELPIVGPVVERKKKLERLLQFVKNKRMEIEGHKGTVK